jgi:hypothetical protein
MKNRGPDLAHGSWCLVEAALPPVRYLEVGANLPPTATPKGATIRRVSSVLFITSTSDND